MFHLHDTAIVLPLFVHFVLVENRFDCCVLLTSVVWICYPHIEEGVLSVAPEATGPNVQTCTVFKVGRFTISLPVGYTLQQWFRFYVVRHYLQKVVVCISDVIVASVHKSPEVAIKCMCDVVRLATRAGRWQVLHFFVVSKCQCVMEF